MKSWKYGLVLLLGVAACGDDKTEAQPVVSAQEVAIQTMKKSLEPSLSRSTDGLVAVPLANGGKRVDLQGRFQTAVIAKVGPDGKLVTECVDNVEAAESFLRAETPAKAEAR